VEYHSDRQEICSKAQQDNKQTEHHQIQETLEENEVIAAMVSSLHSHRSNRYQNQWVPPKIYMKTLRQEKQILKLITITKLRD